MQTNETIATIDTDELPTVTGGASRSNDQVTQALTQIQTSISTLANNNNNQANQLLPVAMAVALSRRSY